MRVDSVSVFINGARVVYAYDSAGHLTDIAHQTSSGSTIASFSYTLDKIGNRLSKSTRNATVLYEYDATYRLTQALSGTPGNSSDSTGRGKGKPNATLRQKEFYSYDPVGNRLSSDRVARYTYNEVNQLISNGGTYVYDKNGNLIKRTTSNGTTLYTWDYENRLVQVVAPDGAVTEFRYDPFGRRVARRVTEEGTTRSTVYFYDGQNLILEYDRAGSVINKYIHGPGADEPLAVTTGKDTYFHHADGLGSVVALTDMSGKIVQSYDYDSFGNLKDQKVRIKQAFTYTGREWDKETALYYYRARFYDPMEGRFISEDPLSFAGGDVNLYGYVAANPINYTDPLGLEAIPAPYVWGWGGAGSSAGAAGAGAGTAVIGATACGTLGSAALVVAGTPSSTSTCADYPQPKECKEDNDKICEKRYAIETQICNAITGKRGTAKGRACHESASQRYSECLRHGPNGITTPLNTWNN